MSKEFDIETLTRPGGMVPVNVETTAGLVRQVLKLREAIEMAANRLEAAMLDEGVCEHCVKVALSYLEDATAPVTNGDNQ